MRRPSPRRAGWCTCIEPRVVSGLAGRRPNSARCSVVGLVIGLCLSARPATAAWQVMQGAPGPGFRAVVQSSRGEIWFGTDSGVGRFTGDLWLPPLQDSLARDDRSVTTLVQDPAGNWWVGLQQRGMVRYDGRSWLHVDAASGRLPSDLVESAIVDRAGDLWVGVVGG